MAFYHARSFFYSFSLSLSFLILRTPQFRANFSERMRDAGLRREVYLECKDMENKAIYFCLLTISTSNSEGMCAECSIRRVESKE